MSGSKPTRKPLFDPARIVAAGALASRVLGLVRDMVLAAVFRRDETDAFFVAFTLPNVLRQVLGEGAAASAVAPVLSKKLSREGPDAARALFQRVRGVAVVVLLAVTVAGVLLARPLTELFAAGYHDRPGMFERTVVMARNMFPYLLFTGVASLGAAALHIKRRYAIASFAPSLLNVAFVAAAFALPAALDARGFDRAQAMVAGALFGAVLQIVVQMPALRRAGWTGPALVDFRDPALREMARRIAPVGLGVLVYAIDLVLSRRFLSDFGPGAQSWFTWAMRLCDFPQQIFAGVVSAVTVTSLGRLAQKSGAEAVAKGAATGLRLSLFFTVPASVALVVLAEPIVVLVFQRGEFDAASSWETSRALVWQASAVWAVASARQLVSLLYAVRDTRMPLIASALDVIAFVALALTLRGRLGHVAISVAVSGASVAQVAVLLVAAKRRVAEFALGATLASAGRSFVAALFAGLAGWSSALLLTPPPHSGGFARALPGLGGLLAFSAMYLAAAWSLRSPELAAVAAAARGRRREAT